ncbi:hypothetical protein [Pedobacter sp. NJ-S-72]
MKYSLLIFSLICTFCGTLFASATMAQKLDRATVTLTITKEKSQQAILKEIEAKTGLHFVYNQDQLSINKQALNETFKNEKVEFVLHKLGFECLEKGDYVIIKKKKTCTCKKSRPYGFRNSQRFYRTGYAGCIGKSIRNNSGNNNKCRWKIQCFCT